MVSRFLGQPHIGQYLLLVSQPCLTKSESFCVSGLGDVIDLLGCAVAREELRLHIVKGCLGPLPAFTVAHGHSILLLDIEKRPDCHPAFNKSSLNPSASTSVVKGKAKPLSARRPEDCRPTSCPTCCRAPGRNQSSGLRRCRAFQRARRPKYGRKRRHRRCQAG